MKVPPAVFRVRIWIILSALLCVSSNRILAGPNDPVLSTNFTGFNFAGGSSIAMDHGLICAGIASAAVGLPGELVFIDVSDPLHPQRVGSTNTAMGINDVALAGNYAYSVGDQGLLEVFDISNPAIPTRLGACSVEVGLSGRRVNAVTVSGSYAYVCSQGAGFVPAPYSRLLTVDVSNPANPRVVGGLAFASRPLRAAISGTNAFVATSIDGNCCNEFQIADITDPTAPKALGGFTSYKYASAADVAVRGQYAFVIDSTYGVAVVDVRDRNSPKSVAAFAGGYRIVISGERAYVAGKGVEITDISQPANPQRVGGYASSGNAAGIVVSGSYIYLLDPSAGLAVLKQPASDPGPAFFTLRGAHTNGVFHLTVQGSAGSSGRVERTIDGTNWLNWQALNFDPSGMVELSDTNTGTAGLRFFRFVRP